MIRLQKYQSDHAEIRESMESIVAAAEADNDGELTEEHEAEFKELQAQLAKVNVKFQREKDLIEAEKSAPVILTAKGNGDNADLRTRVADLKLKAEDDPRRGFKSHREFVMAVIENHGLSAREDVTDERLRVLAVFDKDDKRASGELAFILPEAFTPSNLKAAAGSDEQGVYDDRYGGFTVTPTFLPGMLKLGFEGDPTTGRTQPVPMTTPTVEMTARTDKDHTTSVSGGFTVSRRPETASQTASRMEMEKVTLKATSLFGFAYATLELLTDSPISFAAIIQSGFDDQFAHHMLGEKLRGLGDSEYLGVLSALDTNSQGPTLRVDKENGQAAATVVAENAIKMRSQCWGYGKAIWIANHDTYPQLATMSIAVGTGGALVYQQSIVEDKPDMLLGRPIFYSEYPATLGTVGDLILGNWSEYLDALYQPLQSAESVHVRFDSHEKAFKFWLRNAGAPWWRSALTPNQSTTKLSPFIVLETRS
ncbi:hypothetical protein LCGC14_1464830 [marine sediment metagenome]|uniref:Phage capsid-like C-terminal domain-containing protein n=1 Tax=marine sediment metagenome TaxID=412755 RepID=A0A0F9JEK1_9ZZZZ